MIARSEHDLARYDHKPSSVSELAVGAIALAVVALITIFGVSNSPPRAMPTGPRSVEAPRQQAAGSTFVEPARPENARTSRAQAAPDTPWLYEAARAQQKSQPAETAQVAEQATPARVESFAGVWAREARDCRIRGDDERIKIDARGAESLGARCEFQSVKQEVAGSWRVRAVCSVARDSWTANISLKLVGSNLRWSSERGTETYVRCPRT
jgi:hypothetical protein